MSIPCQICDRLEVTEEWNRPWSDETPSGPDAFRRLVYIGYKNNFCMYQCPLCSQLYEEISWNELFSDGWTEFEKLRKLNAEETKKYLP